MAATVRMICGLPSLSNSDEDLLNFEEVLAISSTLQKLYIWEKKLLEEVKVWLILFLVFPLNWL